MLPAAVGIAFMVSTTLAGCGTGSSGGTSAQGSTVDLRHVVLTSAQVDDLARADDRFAAALWAAVGSKTHNVVVSPASIATALQMIYAGARGTTAAQMAEVLHLQDTAPLDVAAAAARLLGELAPLGTDKKALVALADQVWVQQGMPLLPDFSAAMKTGFRAGLHDADFADHGADARRAINSSVEDSTHGRIRDLIPADFPMDDVRLVLTNAIYLHADWASPFEREQTAPATFTRADGSTVTAPTMHDDAPVDYAAGDGYRAVRLPYAGGRLAMTLLLPDAGRPLAWPATAPVFRSTAVDLALPKFRFTWDDDLSTVLQNLGMRAAFSDAADFSGVTTGATLKIAAVLHKAFVAVDEKGTEAAAATAVIAVVTGAMAPPPTSLHFDRPFLFRIDDLKTGLPLFLGSVADPTLGG